MIPFIIGGEVSILFHFILPKVVLSSKILRVREMITVYRLKANIDFQSWLRRKRFYFSKLKVTKEKEKHFFNGTGRNIKVKWMN